MMNALIQFLIVGTIVVVLASIGIKKNVTRGLSILVYGIGLFIDNGLAFQVILLSAIAVTLLGKLDKETVIMYMIGVCGLLVVTDADEFVVIYIGVEIAGLAFYILAGREREGEKSTEAGVKYFVLGALGSGLMLLGMTLTYAQTGATALG